MIFECDLLRTGPNWIHRLTSRAVGYFYVCTVEGKSKWHHQVFQNSFLLKR